MVICMTITALIDRLNSVHSLVIVIFVSSGQMPTYCEGIRSTWIVLGHNQLCEKVNLPARKSLYDGVDGIELEYGIFAAD